VPSRVRGVRGVFQFLYLRSFRVEEEREREKIIKKLRGNPDTTDTGATGLPML
jgi:hypothetical protein